MPNDTTTFWHVIEEWTSRSFSAGGVMFVVAAALTVVSMVTGAERLSLMVGEAFIAAGWLGGLIGLLGLYPGLADRTRWSPRAGAVFTVIGAVTFVVLALASLVAYLQGGGVGDLPVPFIMLFPGLLAGSLLAFLSFSIASLRTDAYPRTVGLLLLVPPSIFVTNFFIAPLIFGVGPNPPAVIFVVQSGLALVLLAIGYVLRSEAMPTISTEGTAGSATKRR